MERKIEDEEEEDDGGDNEKGRKMKEKNRGLLERGLCSREHEHYTENRCLGLGEVNISQWMKLS